MPKKLYIILLLGVCFIASGFAIDNVILTNKNKELENKYNENKLIINSQAKEIIRLYNDVDNCWYIYYKDVK